MDLKLNEVGSREKYCTPQILRPFLGVFLRLRGEIVMLTAFYYHEFIILHVLDVSALAGGGRNQTLVYQEEKQPN